MSGLWLRFGTVVIATALAGVAHAQVTGQAGQASGTSTQATSADAKAFVQTMLMANMAEVGLGLLGVERASTPEVKSFAQMMVTHHARAHEDLEPVAQRLAVEQPEQLDERHRALVERLSGLEGSEFDREFIRAMVEAHERAVNQLRLMAPGAATHSGTTSSTPPEPVGTSGTIAPPSVAQYAAKTLPIVQQHLAQARQLQARIAK